jgi:hypothetical protein
MEIVIPSTGSSSTIFLILSSPHWQDWGSLWHKTGCTLRQSSFKHSLSSSSFLDMDRVLFSRTNHLTKMMSHRDFLSDVKVGVTNVWNSGILPPTVSDDDTGSRFVNTDCVHRWRWLELLCVTVVSPPRFCGMSWKHLRQFPEKQAFLPI